jgi:D-alanyl-D-alanine carboxypeptidase
MTGLDADALDRALQTFLGEAPETPGALAYVETAGGECWTGVAGVAERGSSAPLWADATFRLASNTKTFTAAAILRLAEEHRLALDARVARYLPAGLVRRLNVIDSVSRGEEITLLHLLRHTSGIHTTTNEGFMDYVRAHPRKRWTPLEKVEWIADEGAASFPPGERYEYNDSGYVILSMVIEQVAGTPLAEAFRSLLGFDRLGLDSVYLETLEDVPPSAGARMPQYLDELEVGTLDPSFDLWGGGGLVSDVADLAGFLRELFAGRVFSSPDTLASMCATVPSGQTEGWDRVGLGIFSQVIGRRVWTHSGFWGTSVMYEPESGLTVAIAVNQSATPKMPFEQLQEHLVMTASP